MKRRRLISTSASPAMSDPADLAAAGPPSLLLSVTEVRRSLGSRKDVRPSLEAHGLSLSDVSVPDGSEIVLDGVIESISEGVVLTGSVAVPWLGSCRRCLEAVAGTSAVDVREIFETIPTDGETWPLLNDQIDVGPLLHDTALLALPLAPLCGDDCQGPVPETYPAAPEDGDRQGIDERVPVDPRWAALDDLEF